MAKPDGSPEYAVAAAAVARLHVELLRAGVPSGEIATAMLASVMNVARDNPDYWRKALLASADIIDRRVRGES